MDRDAADAAGRRGGDRPGDATDERRGRSRYAAARLLGKRPFTQAEVAHAANSIVETSKSRVTTYSQELYNAYVDRYGSADPSAMLGGGAVEARAD